MTLKSQVSRGLKWQVINIAGKQLLSLVVFTTLARLLEPAAFGLLALIALYTYFASLLADLGIGIALVQRKNLEKAHLDTAFWFNIGCNAVLCVTTILLADTISRWMGEPKLAPLLRVASFGLLIGAVSSVQSTLFTKNLDFRLPTIRALIGNLVGGAVGVVMALMGFGVWALVGQLLAGSCAGTIFVCSASPYRPSMTFSFRHLRDLLKVGSAVFANALIWFVSSRLDQLIIGRFAGVPALGLYVVAGKVPDMIKTATQQPIVEVSVPALAKLQDDHPRMRDAIYRGMELNAFVMFPLFVGISVTARDLVPFLFGAKWAPAATLCSLLAIYSLINALQLFFYPALLASGVTGKYVFLNAVQSVGVLVACIIGVQFGVSYLVFALMCNSLILAVPAMLFLRRQIGLSLSEYCRPCVLPGMGSLLMASSVWLLTTGLASTAWVGLRLSISIVLGAGVYIGFSFVLNRSPLNNLIDTMRQAVGLHRTSVNAPINGGPSAKPSNCVLL
ncbi:MAG: lipopolysaccharide biosynthesis protein [Opitutus sp.]